ncbi:unnamed protein product, partial [Tetraodon nigroviridis]
PDLGADLRYHQACEKRLREIDERLKALQKETAALDRRDNELLAEKKHLSELKGKRRQLEQKISTKQDSLRQMEQNITDLKKIEEETKGKVSEVNSQKVAMVKVFIDSIKLKAKLTMEKVYLALKMVELTAEKTKLENDFREGASLLRSMDQKCSQLEQRRAQLTEQCKGHMKRAMSICRMQSKDSLPEDLRNVRLSSCTHPTACSHSRQVSRALFFWGGTQAFAKLPDTPDEIESRLSEERSRAECFTSLSENVRMRWFRRDQEIKQLEKELEEKENALEAYRKNIAEAKERWLNPLKLLVEQINEKFTAFFRSMNCAGEVDLHSENEEDYDKYGIRIRQHSPARVTPYHQSGGERSVSTMLYLMSLQELNRCPFRVVDEINQ